MAWAETVDRPFILAGGLLELGVCQLYRGHLDEATAALTRGLDVCRRFEFTLQRPWLTSSLGYAYALSGRVSDGLSLLREAVEEAEKSGQVAGQAWRLAWLAEAALLAGRPDDAAMWAD